MEGNLRSLSPRFEFSLPYSLKIALLLARCCWFTISIVEILAFAGDGIEALGEIIKDQIDQTK